MLMEGSRYNGFSEENLRAIASRKVNFRMSVKIHVGVYLIVNVFLFIVNFLFTPMFWWVLFPVLAWLIGVAEHVASYLMYARGVYPYAKRGFIFHLIAFIFVNLMLFIINFLTLPSFYWILFPALFWGLGLAIHGISYMVYHRSSADEKGIYQSRREKAIEKELDRMKKKMGRK